MVGANKILTVSYGTFSCTLEGFEDSFGTMKAIAEYFRDLAAEDRYFGAEPATPDADMLQRIAEREIRRRVDASLHDGGILLRAADGQHTPAAEPATPAVAEAPTPETPRTEAPRPEAPRAEPAAPAPVASAPAAPELGSVAAKLARIRAAVDTARTAAPAAPLAQPAETYIEDEELPQPPAAPVMAPAPVEEPVEEPIAESPAFEGATADETGQLPDAIIEDSPREEAVEETAAEDTIVEEPIVEEAAEAEPETAATEPEIDPVLASVLRATATEEYEEEAEAEPAPEPVAAPEELAEPEPAAEEEPAEEEIPAEEFAAVPEEPAEPEATEEAPAEPEIAATEPEPQAEEPAEPAIAKTPFVDPDEDITRRPGSDTARRAVERARARVMKIKRTDLQSVPSGLPEAARGDTADLETGTPDIGAAPGDLPEPTLSAEEEADLMAELAEVERDAARSGPATPRRIRPGGKRKPEEADVSRLVDEINTKMEGSEHRRRRTAIAHLKAAVAATVAERRARPGRNGEAEAEAEKHPYREDLAHVVRPGGRSARGNRMPPLVLVSEQRIDSPEHGSTGNLALKSVVEEQDDSNIFAAEESFADFAARMGATDLSDMIEAAAAYTVRAREDDIFTRPQVMELVASTPRGKEFAREDSLRAFGRHLREGPFERVKRGQFIISKTSRFMS
ncbi:MAG: hypothetical protein SWN98_00390 [Pseudomonadota bacterium]|nr:hypothetical protein [Pseudomonadota bacterium]